MGDTDEEDEYEELGRIRLSITRGQAIAFCEHADAAVSADVLRAIGVMVSLIQMGTYVRDELDRIEILMSADLEIEGRMPWSSNATFAVSARPVTVNTERFTSRYAASVLRI